MSREDFAADAFRDEIDALGNPEKFEALKRRIRYADECPAKGLGNRLLAALQRDKRFQDMVELADLFMVKGERDDEFVRRFCQALIELGRLGTAIALLESSRARIERRLVQLKDEHHKSEPWERLILRRERSEAEGLLGRAYKQFYIDGKPTPQRPLRIDGDRAAECYLQAYQSAPTENLWHGINFTAIRSHQMRLGAAPDPQVQEIANEIVGTVAYLEDQGVAAAWDYATQAEAFVALGKPADAVAPLAKYCHHPMIDSFMRASTLRQFTQFWRLADAPGGNMLLDLLSGKVGSDEHGAGEHDNEPEAGQPAASNVENLQARFTDEPFALRARDALGDKRAGGVGRLGQSIFEGLGSGFLLDGRLFWPDYQGLPLLLTAAHVCSHLEEELKRNPPSSPPEEMTCIFFQRIRGRPAKVVVEYMEALWSSPRDELDATILLLLAAPPAEPYPIATGLPLPGHQAFVISHPLGGGRMFSLEGSITEIGSDRPYFHYTSATEGGSSGGPVFNASWELIGLHRAGNANKKANYGVMVSKIIEKARAELVSRYGPDGPSPPR